VNKYEEWLYQLKYEDGPPTQVPELAEQAVREITELEDAIERARRALALEDHDPEADICQAEADGKFSGCQCCRASAILNNALKRLHE
jgi:hypothetical protein